MKVLVRRTETYICVVEAESVAAVEAILNGVGPATEALLARIEKGYDNCYEECEEMTP
jgi:hypothetical protein